MHTTISRGKNYSSLEFQDISLINEKNKESYKVQLAIIDSAIDKVLKNDTEIEAPSIIDKFNGKF